MDVIHKPFYATVSKKGSMISTKNRITSLSTIAIAATIVLFATGPLVVSMPTHAQPRPGKVSFCRFHPNVPACRGPGSFCRVHPNAPACASVPFCRANPNVPACNSVPFCRAHPIPSCRVGVARPFT